MTTNTRFELIEFVDYCWGFYGPGKMHGDFFDNTLTLTELTEAVKARVRHGGEHFAADSIDREFVRDLMLTRRGQPTEHTIAEYVVADYTANVNERL